MLRILYTWDSHVLTLECRVQTVFILRNHMFTNQPPRRDKPSKIALPRNGLSKPVLPHLIDNCSMAIMVLIHILPNRIPSYHDVL